MAADGGATINDGVSTKRIDNECKLLKGIRTFLMIDNKSMDELLAVPFRSKMMRRW